MTIFLFLRYKMIDLEWNNTSIVDDYEEPNRFVYPYCGDIIHIDEYDSRIRIGKFSALFVSVSNALNENEHIFDVLDCHSSSLAEYYAPIFGDNAPDFSDKVDRLSRGYIDGLDLLVIDRIEILPEFRGKSIGLRVIRHMMSRFSVGAGVIALKAFPLQFEGENSDPEHQAWGNLLSLDRFVNNKRVSKAKLKKYYKRLGFVSLPGSDFMIFPTGLKIPTIEP